MSHEESSYKRGYTHGYLAALDDMNTHGSSNIKLTEFYNDYLLPWREKPSDIFLAPPLWWEKY